MNDGGENRTSNTFLGGCAPPSTWSPLLESIAEYRHLDGIFVLGTEQGWLNSSVLASFCSERSPRLSLAGFVTARVETISEITLDTELDTSRDATGGVRGDVRSGSEHEPFSSSKSDFSLKDLWVEAVDGRDSLSVELELVQKDEFLLALGALASGEIFNVGSSPPPDKRRSSWDEGAGLPRSGLMRRWDEKNPRGLVCPRREILDVKFGLSKIEERRWPLDRARRDITGWESKTESSILQSDCCPHHVSVYLVSTQISSLRQDVVGADAFREHHRHHLQQESSRGLSQII
jgi:hypothetical protein